MKRTGSIFTVCLCLFLAASASAAPFAISDTYTSRGAPGDSGIKFSADGTTILYVANQGGSSNRDLYATSVTSVGTGVQLNPAFSGSNNWINDDDYYYVDNTTVLLLADPDAFPDRNYLYRNNVAGTDQTLLSDGSSSVGTAFAQSPNGVTVGYREAGQFYSRGIASGAAQGPINTQVTHGTADSSIRSNNATMNASSKNYMFAGNDRVVYTSNHETDDLETNSVFQLYTRLADATGAEVRLNTALDTGDTSAENVIHTVVRSDGNHVFYMADDGATDEEYNLYHAAIGGGGATKINAAGSMVDEVRPPLEFSRDETKLLYLQQVSGAGQSSEVDIYSRNSDGSGVSVLLNGTIESISPYAMIQTSSDSRVVFRGESVGSNDTEVFSAPIGGGTIEQLNDDMAGVDINYLEVSPDGTKVIYRTSNAGGQRVYSCTPDGAGSPTELGSDAMMSFISNGGGYVKFMDDTNMDWWVVDIDGGTAVKVEDALTLGVGETVDYVWFNSDDSRIVYEVNNGSNVYTLYSISTGEVIPEPATMSLLALGGLALLRRRKR